ncbi:MAG: hypothetical protein JO089_00375 [Alphaproteobacteria bacterium]|nr:hypothetical protein [Alphaproteobacteria bacterium]
MTSHSPLAAERAAFAALAHDGTAQIHQTNASLRAHMHRSSMLAAHNLHLLDGQLNRQAAPPGRYLHSTYARSTGRLSPLTRKLAMSAAQLSVNLVKSLQRAQSDL